MAGNLPDNSEILLPICIPIHCSCTLRQVLRSRCEKPCQGRPVK